MNGAPKLLASLWSRLDGSLRARIFVPISLLFTGTLAAMGMGAVSLHMADIERVSRKHAELFATMIADGVSATMMSGVISDIPAVL
ncbi:MAG: hypothetical protein ACYC8T_10370, partial [Myxococcaceae bacterium]